MGSHGHRKIPVCARILKLHLWMVVVEVAAREWGNHQEWDQALKKTCANDSGMQLLLLSNRHYHTTEPHHHICCLFLPGECGIPVGRHTLEPVLSSHLCQANRATSSLKITQVISVLSLSIQWMVVQKERHHQPDEPTSTPTGTGAQACPVTLTLETEMEKKGHVPPIRKS